MIDLATILRRLVEEGVAFVIIGGVAATVHGSSYVDAQAPLPRHVPDDGR